MDYENFDRKLKYLSAKLLTIFVEHPIIFIGYGLGDVNIRKLFKEIAECLTAEQLNKIKDNFIFILPTLYHAPPQKPESPLFIWLPGSQFTIIIPVPCIYNIIVKFLMTFQAFSYP